MARSMRWTGWSRWAGLLAGAAGVALGLVAATPGPACACSCVGFSLPESFARADVVFAGELVSRDETFDKATLVFEVSSVYKGEAAKRQEIVTHASGASCGLELTGPGPHLVFGNAGGSEFEPSPGEGQYVSSLCGGSQPLTDAIRAELRPVARATEPIPVKAGPVEPAAERPNAAAAPADPGESGWISAAAGGGALLVAAAGVGGGIIAWRRRRSGGSHG